VAHWAFISKLLGGVLRKKTQNYCKTLILSLKAMKFKWPRKSSDAYSVLRAMIRYQVTKLAKTMMSSKNHYVTAWLEH